MIRNKMTRKVQEMMLISVEEKLKGREETDEERDED
jgi:hypothetical protein